MYLNWYLRYHYISEEEQFSCNSTQGRSQNLEEVPQNFTEVFNIDDVTANDVIQRNQHRKQRK